MPFCVNVAADLYGKKHNLKLSFPLCPTMSELINSVESQYDTCARANRPAGYPDVPFRVQGFQLYDDVLRRWVDLYCSSQLTHQCQAFCFQPDSIWHSDAVGLIPPPKETITWVSDKASPPCRTAKDGGQPPTLSEKMRAVFYDLDCGNKGYVQYSDLRAGFSKCGIEFTETTVGDLFQMADADRDGHVSYDEWVQFALSRPSVIDALFFRMRDANNETRTWLTKVDEEVKDQRRRREEQLQDLHNEATWATSRARQMLDFEEAKREADIARLKHEISTRRERKAFDTMATTHSPASLLRNRGKP